MHPLNKKAKRGLLLLLLCALVLVLACAATAVLPLADFSEAEPGTETSAEVSYEEREIVSETVPTQANDSQQNEAPNMPRPYGQTRSGEAEEHILDVPFMSQAAYPTGCESISTIMLLQYYGIEMDADTFIDEYLETGDYYVEDDIFYAPHPNDAFVGDPRSVESYGCYSPVIYRALQKCLPEGYTVADVSGTGLEDLCRSYIDLGHPVLMWATMYMVESSEGPTWHLPDSEETYTWINSEHCLVLVGYDDEYYYFNDPLSYDAPTAYSRALAEQRYAELGMQALIVFP